MMKNNILTDIRIYKFAVNVYPKPIKANIEMRVPLGDEVK